MKNLKKLSFGLAALVMAFGLVFSVSAFKERNSAKKGAAVFFKYEGSSFNEAAYRNISNWKQTTAPEEESCIGEQDICILSVDSDNLTASGSMADKLDYFFNTDLSSSGQVAGYVNAPANRVAEQN